MKQKQSLWLLAVNGDLRQNAAIAELAKQHWVDEFNDDAKVSAGTYDAVLLPMPVTSEDKKIPLALLADAVKAGGMILGGRISETAKMQLVRNNATIADYAAREEFAIRNAIPTAEAAVQIALTELPVTLHGCRCLILGAGRVGRALQIVLRGMGADVTVSARRCSDLAWRQCCEGKPSANLNIRKSVLCEIDICHKLIDFDNRGSIQSKPLPRGVDTTAVLCENTRRQHIHIAVRTCHDGEHLRPKRLLRPFSFAQIIEIIFHAE